VGAAARANRLRPSRLGVDIRTDTAHERRRPEEVIFELRAVAGRRNDRLIGLRPGLYGGVASAPVPTGGRVPGLIEPLRRRPRFIAGTSTNR
jgi:hypothetical protein